MATVFFSNSPKTTDEIVLQIQTPDATGCLTSNPYKVDSVTVYFVERDFLGSNFGEFTDYQQSDSLVQDVIDTKNAVCDDPSQDNIQAYEQAVNKLSSSSIGTTFFYRNSEPIEVIGNSNFPAWLSTDVPNSPFQQALDEDGNPITATFQYLWLPQGSIREGDYFLCWTWSPLLAGDKMSASQHFKVEGDTQAVVAIPTHQTNPDKYSELLERYLPETYKTILCDGDVTAKTTESFNEAVAQGFTFMENFANQIIDLFDANAVHESLLVYLSNLFDLKLKSSDPTLWRRQIKEAIPLFKQKGTYPGLVEAFAQAGMTLLDYTQYWQLVSPWTWEESFEVVDSVVFELAKDNIELPIDDDNFGLWVRRDGTSDYVSVSKDNVSFETGEDLIIRMTWIGDQLSSGAMSLNAGDIVRVLYEYNDITSDPEQQLQNYILSLPLADQRDEEAQDNPPKNWNVRLIAENDPLFDVLIPVKTPFHDSIIFGFIRTEFGYSENIYNMDEYNGSTRPSTDPCFIDKTFLDPCSGSLGSKYSVDIGVEELSNDRMGEAQDILRENMPFHAQLHTISFTGEVNEFVQSPVETIESLVTMDHLDNILSGQSNPFFHRIMEGGLAEWVIQREDLADKITVNSGKYGTANNQFIYLYAPSVNFRDAALSGTHHFEVLAPSMNAGAYNLQDWDGHLAKVTTVVTEPLDTTQFTFNLSNITHWNTYSTISQDDLFTFSDANVNFAELGVKTLWDVAHTPNYTGGSWKVSIPAYSGVYNIIDIVEGTLILQNNGSLPTSNTSGISYTLKNDLDNPIATSSTGSLTVAYRGYVNLNEPALVGNIHEVANIGYYLNYSGTDYLIVEFDGANFWIADYTAGNVGGANVQVRKRIADHAVGQFGYKGLTLTTLVDHESEFGIMDGDNPPDIITDDNNFKENYMILIGSDFYKILEWNAEFLRLDGRQQSWGVYTGTVVAYSVVYFPKKQINVQFTVFNHLDRDGDDPVIETLYNDLDQSTIIQALSLSPGTGIQEMTAQEEGISFVIETRDGSTQQGEL